MGLDIDSHNQFQSPGFQGSPQGNASGQVTGQPGQSNVGNAPNPNSSTGQNRDTLSSGGSTSSNVLTSNTTSSTPVLTNPGNSESLGNQISNTIREHSLPTGRDLSNQLSEETLERLQQEINRFVDEGHSFDIEMKKFFDLLSKMYPFSLALLSSLFGAEGKEPGKILDKTMQLLNELGKLLGKNLDKLNLPENVKAQLKQIAEQLANMSLSGDTSQLKNQIDKLLQGALQTLSANTPEGELKDLAAKLKGLIDSNGAGGNLSFDTDSELFQKLQEMGLLSKSMIASKSASLDDLKLLLSQLQGGKEGSSLAGSQPQAQALLQNASSMLQMMGMMKGFSQQEQMLGFTNQIAMQSMRSPDSALGLLGPSVDKFTENIGKFLNNIQNSPRIFPDGAKGKEGEVLIANAFKQTILSASVLGNLIASRAGKEAAEDTVSFSLLKLQSAKELGIIDQIPFSFMAFFADLSSNDESLSDAVAEAKQSLFQLVRILLKLIFVLAAIATAGQKLGKDAMDKMLVENTDFITRILDSLSFALKKVDENYVVSVNVHIALAQSAKDYLALEDFEPFWNSIIQMFSPKTELASFLKDMEEAKPLFKTLETMLTESEQTLPVSIPLSL